MLGKTFGNVASVFVFLLFFTGCVANSDAHPPTAKKWIRTELIFGEVSKVQWEQFLATEVTPRFPDGLTWLPVQGQWKAENGKIVMENSRILLIVHPGSSANEKAIETIRSRFLKRYHQESVLRIDSNAWVSF